MTLKKSLEISMVYQRNPENNRRLCSGAILVISVIWDLNLNVLNGEISRVSQVF